MLRRVNCRVLSDNPTLPNPKHIFFAAHRSSLKGLTFSRHLLLATRYSQQAEQSWVIQHPQSRWAAFAESSPAKMWSTRSFSVCRSSRCRVSRVVRKDSDWSSRIPFTSSKACLASVSQTASPDHNHTNSTKELNYMVTEDKLKKGAMCRLKTFQSNQVKDKP